MTNVWDSRASVGKSGMQLADIHKTLQGKKKKSAFLHLLDTITVELISQQSADQVHSRGLENLF